MRRPIVRPLRRRLPRPPQMRRITGLSFNRMLPNVITLLALCAGMTAIRYALHEKYEAAVVAIMVAAVLDGLDGRVARLLKASSSFGAQLDSLSDFVGFGVAPAFLLYLWTMERIGGVGWGVALLFGVCSALRLARFNTQLGIPDVPPYAYNFFTGVPAPAAAGLAMLPLCASFETGLPLFRSPYPVAALTVVIAGLMVSRVPTFSGKRFRVPAEYAVPLLLGVGLLFAGLTTEPWATLLAIGVGYVATFPLSIRSYARLRAAAEALRAGRGQGEPAGSPAAAPASAAESSARG